MIAIISTIMVFYFKKKENRQQIAELDLKQKEQEAINRKYIAGIIDGHYESKAPEIIEGAKKAFEKWQMFQKKMFKDAPPEKTRLRNKYAKEGNSSMFKPFYFEEVPWHEHGIAKKLFMKDVFTEPFPSTHDMPDWALRTQIADIMILNGITPNQSRNFFIHIKNHFVNHEMVRGIIQFDIYQGE
jgi:hypothetical protein